MHVNGAVSSLRDVGTASLGTPDACATESICVGTQDQMADRLVIRDAGGKEPIHNHHNMPARRVADNRNRGRGGADGQEQTAWSRHPGIQDSGAIGQVGYKSAGGEICECRSSCRNPGGIVM